MGKTSAVSFMRYIWLALAVLLAVSFSTGHKVAVWLVIWTVPWALGAVILSAKGFATHVSTASMRVLRLRAVQIALAVQLIISYVLAHLFTLQAGLLYVLWGGVLWLVLLAARKDTVLVSVLSNGTTVLVAGLVALAGLELLLQLPALGNRLGTPSEHAAWSKRYDGLHAYNLFGIRSPYEDVKREPETLRILALGDSYTWGALIADADSAWPGLLEAHLRQEDREMQVQVINMGRGGYTTVNEAELLRRLGWQFNPDLVVVQFGANDALPGYPGLKFEIGDWLYPKRRFLPSRFRKGAISQTALYQQVSKGVNGFLNRSYDRRELLTKLYEPTEPTWLAFRGALEEMGDSARVRQVPIVLMIFPDMIKGRWTAESYPLAPVNRVVSDAAQSAGFRVLDLTPVFAARNEDARRWHAMPYDAHPNAEAQNIAAVALMRYLDEHGLLEQAPQPRNLMSEAQDTRRTER